jgi:hypothetical protein
MGVDVNIYLEPHAKTEQIFEVLLKLFGNDFEPQVFDREPTPDYDNNPSLENRWYIEPIKNAVNQIELSDPTYFRFTFTSCIGEIFSHLVHLDCDEGHIPVSKALMPHSTATWCAIGKRLVDFFGGKLVYSDSTDDDDPKNYYLVTNPKFPAKTKNEDPNERFYKYYSLLHNEKTITAQEINSMKEHCAYFTDTDEHMISFLEKFVPAQELSKELSKELNKKSDTKKTKQKTLKV